MDNSFGARPPWTGRPPGPGGAYPPQAMMRNMQPGIDPRYMLDLSAQGQMMNGYGMGPVIRPGIATPSSVGGGYPMWDMDIPSQMFMQTVNFDRLMQQQGMADTSVSTASNRSEDVSQRSEAGRDLIEQQQAMEQARLLQRFKELRQWQQQQQEVLMSQQQQQLSLLKKEQEKMQTMISKQRDNQWGGGHSNMYSNTETPPRRQVPHGADMFKYIDPKNDVNESKSSLPRPVIYIQPKEDDDEIKTNPDLFSDTNSNRGSQAAMDDGMFPIPDSASEASVEVGIHQLRQSQVKSSVLRQRLNPHELDAPKKLHRSFAELEQDAEFMNLSSQSPTFLDVQHGKPPDERTGKIEEEDEPSNDDDDDDDDDDNTTDDDSDDDEDDDESDSDYAKEDTQIEVHKDGHNIDDVPIKPGIEGGKTFEQLLEEQLQAEEERLRQANMNEDSPSQPKRTFLKKGEGIARFESKPGQKPHRPKKPVHKTSNTASKSSDPQKSSSNTAQNKQGSKVNSKPPSQSKAGSQKPNNQSLKLLKNDPKGKKHSRNDAAKQSGTQDSKSESNAQKKQNIKRNDSIPDDASFVANLKERQKESERDMEDLDEFEILEQFADNMSFCSNSSIVTKGLRGLQNDRILTGVVPKSHELARPTSPRAMLIKKLEFEKQSKMSQKGSQHSRTDSSKVVSEVSRGVDSKKVEVKVTAADDKVGKTVAAANGDEDDDSDEYESVSDDSSDASDDSAEKKVSEGVQTQGGVDLNYYLRPGLNNQSSANKSKNDSVLSTDKKLERALSYTGFTETSMTSDSEQDLGSDNDDDDDSDDNDDIKISPSKVITRKVAGRDDKNKLPFQNLVPDSEFSNIGYNAGALMQKGKSPLVISKEKVSSEKNWTNEIINEETKFSYHSDSDSVGNKHNESLSEGEESQFGDVDKSGKKVFNEKKTLLFDDEEEWGELTPQVLKSRKQKESDVDHDKTLVEEPGIEIPGAAHNIPQLSDKNEDATPPTSKLVSKLFPNLKPAQKKQEEQDLEKIQTVNQSSASDGVQSKVLRDKLMELEREIEKFRNENKHLTSLRSEREKGLVKLKKEIEEFEKEKCEELKRIEEFRNEEMKKLKHEKKMFEKYQKAARAGPDKKEREEIENLKSQVAELQDELKRKESRWTANNSRLRDKIDFLEQENDELKEEIKLLEKKRLEWMQKDQRNKSTKGAGQLLRSSTPTEELDHLTNGHIEHGYNDLSGSTTSRQAMNSKPSHHHKPNIHSSQQPGNKSTAHNQTGSQSTQNKHSNVNQSAKQNVTHSSLKSNQSKKTLNSHTKHGATGTSHSHGNKAGHKPGGKSNTSVSSMKTSNSNDSKNVLRNSLTEDLPRRDLGTIAEPQDMSMYSEADVETRTNLPRKFATTVRPSVDTSVIDKGDNDEYDEVQHSDGKVERTYKTGAREILFSNGTRKEISADGKSIVVSFFNGDVKQILADQRVIYYYAENQTTHTNYPDGLEIIQFPNQQTEKLYPDGTKEITFPDQTIKYLFPNGSEESVFADGTVIRLEKNGDKTMEFPNGQREIHTQEFKKREYPDGTVKTVYPDGRQETRYSNGRLRVKDKDGNIIVDRQC